MLDKLVLLVIATTLPLSFASPDLRLFFPHQKQYTYEVHASITAGLASDEAHASLSPGPGVGTTWALTGRLTAQVLNDSQVRFELGDIKVHVLSKNDEHVSYQFEEEVKPLKFPWIVEYYKCLIESIYLPKEPTWVSNLKRGLSLNFQLKNGEGFYTNNEPCIHDYNCLSTYESNGTYIKKYSAAPTSPKYGNSWISVPWTKVGHTVWSSIPDTTTMVSEREYKLSEKSGLLEMNLEESITYRIEERNLQMFTEINIKYETERHTVEPEWPELTRSSIKYDRDSCLDSSCGIRSYTQKSLRSRTYELLMKISKKGIDADNIVRNSSMIHSLDFVDLLNTISHLNYTNLRRIFDDLVLGTSYELETSRNIYLEVLPYSGSKASVKFVKYLVVEEKEKVEDSTLLTLIRKLPFTGANYTQELLQELEAFTNLGLDFPQEIRHAAILSFATLLHKTKKEGQVSDDYFDNMVVKYVRMYSDCPHYIDRLTWLQGLCNIGFWAQKYTMEIFTDPSKPRSERLWAAFAFNSMDNQYYMSSQTRITELLLPIFANQTEDVQIKMAAVHVALAWPRPTQSELLVLRRYARRDPRLARFWRMALDSVRSAGRFDDYQRASIYAPILADVEYPSAPNHWGTNNLIVSSEDHSTWVHLISTADDADLPNFAGLRMSVNGRRVSVYVIAEGIASNIYKRMHNFNENDLKVDKLVELLKEFKAFAVQPAEEVRIDFVVKIQEKAVFLAHMNQTRFESWNLLELAKSVNEFLKLGSHINQQMVYYPSHQELIFPNELGIPVTLQTTSLSFTSIRGNLTTPSTDLHIRYQGVSLTSLSTFGPLIQSEHSVRVQSSTVAHLPIRFNLTAAPGGIVNFISPNLQRGGIVLHTRTQVEKRVNGSSDAYTVTAQELDPSEDDSEINESSIYFDCGHSSAGLGLEHFFTTVFYNFLNTLHPSHILFSSIPTLVTPSYKSCGVIYPPKSLGEDKGLVATLVVDEAPIVAGFISGKQKELNVSLLVKYYKQFSDSSEEEIIFKLDGDLAIQNLFEKSIIRLTMNGSWPGTPKYNWDLIILNEDSYIFPKRIPLLGLDYQGLLDVKFRSEALEGNSRALGGNSEALEGKHLLVVYNGTAVDQEGNKKIDVKIKNTNVQQEILTKLGFRRDSANHDESINDLNASLKVKNGIASLSIDRVANVQFASLGFDWLFDMWTNWKIYNYGLYRECRLNKSSSNVRSLHVDGSGSAKLAPLQCGQRIALADCTQVPRFAVLRQKDGRLKIYAGGFFVTLGRFDGRIVVNETQSGGHLNVTEIQDGVKIFSQLSGVQVLYKQNDTSILVPNSHLHAVCGECMGQDYSDC